MEDIRNNNYVLTPGRYVGINTTAVSEESYDEQMRKLTNELSSLMSESQKLDIELKDVLGEMGYEI